MLLLRFFLFFECEISFANLFNLKVFNVIPQRADVVVLIFLEDNNIS